MMSLNNGDFIMWTSGDVNHIGRFVCWEDGNVVMEVTEEGSTMTIPFDDGTFKKVKQPKNWSLKVEEDEESKKPAQVKKERAPREKKGPTKVDLIAELLKENPVNSRKEAIELIVQAGITTAAGASTFYNQVKKQNMI